MAIFEIVPNNGSCQSERIRYYVTVNPRLSATSNMYSNEICSDIAVAFDLTTMVTMGNGGDSLQFSISKGFETLINPINAFVVNPDDSVKLYLRALNTFTGCYMNNDAIDSLLLIVYSLPQASAFPAGAYTNIGGTTQVIVTNYPPYNLITTKPNIVIRDTTIASIHFVYDSTTFDTTYIYVTGNIQGNAEIVYTYTNEAGCEKVLIIPVQVQIEESSTAILVSKDMVKCNVPGGDTTTIQIAYIMGGVAPWTVTISDDRGIVTIDTVINDLSELPLNITVIIPGNTGNVPEYTLYTITNVTDAMGISSQFHYGEVGIEVNPTPRIDSIANREQEVCAGQNTFPVSFTGIATVYAWQIDNNMGIVNYTTETIPPFVAENTDTVPVTITIIVTPEYWNNGLVCTGESDTVIITINPAPLAEPVEDRTVCSGSPITINFGDSSNVYEWSYISGDNVLSVLSGVGNISLDVVENTFTAPLAGVYSVIPVFPAVNGACRGEAQLFTITVLPTPMVNPIADQHVCHYETTTEVAFSGNVADATYRWTNSDITIGLPAYGTGTILPFRATNNDTITKEATITVTPEYTLNGVTCVNSDSIYSFSITVDIIPFLLPVVDTAYCADEIVPAVVLSSSFWWRQMGDDIGLSVSSAVGDIPEFVASNTTTNQKTAIFEITSLYGVCAGNISSFSITILPNTTVDPIANLNFCHYEMTNEIVFSGNAAGATYRWTNSDTTIGLPESGTGNIPSFRAINTNSITTVATITVIPEYELHGVSCVSATSSQSFIITVEPIPINIFDSTYCIGESVEMPVLSPDFEWRQTGDDVGLSDTVGVGNIPSFVATNNTDSIQTAVFELTPLVGNCAGSIISFYVTVLPNTTIDAIADQRVCHNEMTNEITFSGNAIDATYRWTNSDTTIGLPASGIGNILPFRAINNDPAIKVATLTATPEYTLNGITCVNSDSIISFTITVDSIPELSTIFDASYCTGENVLEIELSDFYTWQQTGDNIGLAIPSGMGTIPSFVANNNTAHPLTATFEIIFDNGTCQSEAVYYNVTIEPSLPATIDKDRNEICSDIAVAFDLTTMVSVHYADYTLEFSETREFDDLVSPIDAFVVNPDESITLYVRTLHTALGCLTDESEIDSITLVVNSFPIVEATPANAYASLGGTGLIIVTNYPPYDLITTKPNVVIRDSAIASIEFVYDSTTFDTTYIYVTGEQEGTTEIIYNYTNEAGCDTVLIIPVQVLEPSIAILLSKDIARCNLPGGGDTATVEIVYIMGGVAPWTVTISDDQGTFTIDTVINDLDDLPVTVTVIIPENLSNVPEYTSYTISSVIDSASIPTYYHYGEVRIITNPTPSIDSITNPEQTVCAGENTLEVSFMGVATIYTWQMDKNIGSTYYISGDIPSFVAENTDTFPVTAIVTVTPQYWDNGLVCIGNSDTVLITVNPTPFVNIVGEISVPGGCPITIDFDGSADVYEWSYISGDNVLPVSSGTGNIYFVADTTSVPLAGIYSVTPVYDAVNGGCRGIEQLFTITITTDVGISESIQASDIIVYPNPVSHIVYIKTANQTIPEVKLYIPDGRLLVHAFSTEIDMSTYSAGIYFLQVDGKWMKIVKN